MMKPVDILVFSPHPDDAEIGCAGTIVQETGRDRRVAVADLTEGECASLGNPETRSREREAASALMGLCDRFSLGLPDTHIGTAPEQRLALVELIRKIRPRIVLAPYGHDRHPDHEGAGRLVREAVFYAGVAKVGTAEVYRPAAVYYYMIHTEFRPSFIVDISAVLEKKREILKAYVSQFSGGKTAISKPAFSRYLEARAYYYGAQIGVQCGEPFVSHGPLGFSSLPETLSGEAYRCY